MLTTLVLSLTLAGNPGDWAYEPHESSQAQGWLVGGAACWAPVGLGVGMLASLGTARQSGDGAYAIGGTLGALAGIGLGLLLGWAAMADLPGGKFAALAPLFVVAGVLVFGGYMLINGHWH